MVQMFRSNTNIAAGEVEFVNIDGYKADLMGTAVVLLSGKYRQEHHNIKCYQCQNMGYYAYIFPEKVDKA